MTAAEFVLGLPRSLVPGGLEWRGVRATDLRPYVTAVARHGTFRPRDEVEDDPSWKQIIPYVVLFDAGRLYLMRRTRAGGDARLHERYSIGIGGHINPSDRDVHGGLEREWHEELAVDFLPAFEPIGVLNDDQDPVGAVHLGLVYAADAAGRPVEIRETHKLSGRFVDPGEVVPVRERLETWSLLLFDFLGAQPGRLTG